MIYVSKILYNSPIRLCSVIKRSIKTEISITELIENSSIQQDPIQEDEKSGVREDEIEKKRNKSRLLPQHRNMLFNQVPYNEPQSWIHETVKYKRKMFGKYGFSSGVEPGICWPAKDDLKDVQEYERVAFPHSISEMIEMAKEKQRQADAATKARQEDIGRKILKLNQWEKELKEKVRKKEAEALAAKERRDRLVDEVRRHFGFKIDPKDERFKEMLEKKDKEDKKMQKEARKKAKEQLMFAKLQEQFSKASEQKGVIKDSKNVQ